MRKTLIPVFFVLILLSACEEDTLCNSIYSSSFTVTYFDLQFEGSDSLTVEQDTPFFTSIFPINLRDSLILEDTFAAELILTVDPENDFTTYLIVRDGVVDSLSVGYNRRQRLISEGCGPEQLYVDFEVIGSNYDSIRVLHDDLLKSHESVVEVYL